MDVAELRDWLQPYADDTVEVLELRERERPDIDFKDLAKEADAALHLSSSTIGVDADTGEIVFVYLNAGQLDVTNDVRASVLRVEPMAGQTVRQNGISGRTLVFGFMPRVTGRNEWCRAARVRREYPEEWAHLAAAGELLGRLYEKIQPDVYVKHIEMLQEVGLDYRFGDGPYTSGIINYGFSIPYHCDAGNFRGCWSAMYGFRRDALGGHLVFPTYDVMLEIGDGSLSFFNGQQVIHGVTPIRNQHRNSYRITAVWYSLKQLWNCLPPKDELARFRKLRTEREFARRDRGREEAE